MRYIPTAIIYLTGFVSGIFGLFSSLYFTSNKTLFIWLLFGFLVFGLLTGFLYWQNDIWAAKTKTQSNNHTQQDNKEQVQASPSNKLTHERSPIYDLIKAEVDNRGNLFIMKMIDPWIFFNSSGIEITKSNGKKISLHGIAFGERQRQVFWDSFVNEELTELSRSLFEYTRAMAIDRKLPVESSIAACRECLYDLTSRAFNKMADIDQKLRGKGSPNSVPREDDKKIEERISRVRKVIDKFASANMAHNTKAPANEISNRPKQWYEKPIGIIIIGVLIAVISVFVIFGIKYFFPNLKL